MILDGRLVASTILDNIRTQITTSPGVRKPMLAVVLVGHNPASESYIRMKERRAREVGMQFGLYRYDTSVDQATLESRVRELSADPRIDGLIVQSPLPPHIDPYRVIECIDPTKDVDGFTRTQIGNMVLGHEGLASCTPEGIMTLLSHYQIDVQGLHVVIVGRSNIVGKPLAMMMINAGATVTDCNSHTRDLSHHTRQADIVVLAAGQPGLLTREMVREDAIVIDVGCTFVEGVACGDADYDDLHDHVRAISPVPGGIGPMTVATLIEHTWRAYEGRGEV